MALPSNIKLSDGNYVPLIGLGTYKSQPGDVFKAVKCAIECGYRHLDCAPVYFNENEVGKAIKEKIDSKSIVREDIFVTSKVWNTFHRKEKVIEACQQSLKSLQLDYLDLYLIHWPIAFKEGYDILPKDENGKVLIENIDIAETWKGMEECKETGLVKYIGLSNFNSEQIKRILNTCKIKPVMLQVECHPYLNQNKLIEFCRNHEIAVTAFSPLGRPGYPRCAPDEPTLIEEEKVKELAKKYDKSPAQILLRYNAQRGLIVIPKSVTKDRIISNIQIFDFELTPEDIDALNNFKTQYRYSNLKWLGNDSVSPFLLEY